ncbi:unnamed protein product [Oncorhynchus mykiss]|uniref:Protein phosphatase 1 regulatory subunit 14A n=1 Tax=Oncorhynchus mykiss TaxID=8022 RepID=A0A060W779_ONCMY|nr:unnamed protein product [Oncorhynchus mykiss]
MAANRVGRRCNNKVHSPSRGPGRDPGLSLQKRQARVTVKYNRKELQRRLDVEKWIDCSLDELYVGRVSPIYLKLNGFLLIGYAYSHIPRQWETFI